MFFFYIYGLHMHMFHMQTIPVLQHAKRHRNDTARLSFFFSFCTLVFIFLVDKFVLFLSHYYVCLCCPPQGGLGIRLFSFLLVFVLFLFDDKTRSSAKTRCRWCGGGRGCWMFFAFDSFFVFVYIMHYNNAHGAVVAVAVVVVVVVVVIVVGRSSSSFGFVLTYKMKKREKNYFRQGV